MKINFKQLRLNEIYFWYFVDNTRLQAAVCGAAISVLTIPRSVKALSKIRLSKQSDKAAKP
jgi:hypothetical protein